MGQLLKLILASQSVQRQTLLNTLPIAYAVIPADIDEKSILHPDYTQRVQLIAQAKAEKVAYTNPESIIIAADTVIVHDEQVFEKPIDLVEAKKMLSRFSDQWIEECTGVYCISPAVNQNKAEILSLSVKVKAKFRPLSESEISNYIEQNPVLTWAGAISPAYPEGQALFEQVKGSMTGFTHGFPMEVIIPFLKNHGYL